MARIIIFARVTFRPTILWHMVIVGLVWNIYTHPK